MTTVSGVTTFDAAGVTFCEIPEGDAVIDHETLGQKPKSHHVRVGKFALAQRPGRNFELDYYAAHMDGFTHGRVARRKSDGRPFVVERTRKDGNGSQPGAGVIAFDEGSSVLVRGGALVRLVPDPDRYVIKLGENAAHFIGSHLPATLMTGLESLGWTDFLSQISGRDVTLPTHLQWQYAAQGGLGSRYVPHGRLNAAGYIINDDKRDKRQGPAPLNHEGWQQLLNPLGLLDMTKNVWQPTLVEGPITPEMDFYLKWFGGSWRSSDVTRVMLMGGVFSGVPDNAYGITGGVRPAVVFPQAT